MHIQNITLLASELNVLKKSLKVSFQPCDTLNQSSEAGVCSYGFVYEKRSVS